MPITKTETMKTQQRYKILALLKRGKPINQVQAICLFGCYRLSARIKELRDEFGDNAITTTINRDGMAVYKWEGAK